MFNFYEGEVARIDQWTILAPRTWARLIGSLGNDNGDVNKDGKKSNRVRLAKQQLCTCITLFRTLPWIAVVVPSTT